jgi:trk system potassium uptake protein TrkA
MPDVGHVYDMLGRDAGFYRDLFSALDNNVVLRKKNADGVFVPVSCTREFTQMMECTPEEFIDAETRVPLSTVVEEDRERCEALCDLVPEAHVVCGDATRSDVLQEDGLSSADAFVALAGDDGDNFLTSLYAKSCNLDKIVVKVNRDYFAEILENAGLDSIVSPKEIVSQQLARYVRAMSNSVGSSMETLYRLADGKIEALEFKVSPDSACVNVPLKDLKLRPNILISAIIRGSRSIIPDGDARILPGDHAVIVTAAGRLKDLDAIVEEKQ